ncbi:MAG: hypothetical protein JNK21_04050 [Rhodospirillaceae bacterium]|nr:hypothetical protein [Rhodospirillaceae bacterium]
MNHSALRMQAAFLLLPGQLLAQSVHIQANDVGQGLLRQIAKECYVLTPEHVVTAASRVTLKGEGLGRGTAELATTFADDLAALRVTGGDLGCSPWADTGKFAEFIKSQNDAVVQTINADGSLSKRFVRIAEVDGRYIQVRPASNNDNLFQGLSGSAVYAGNKLIGMLQSVDAATTAGLILTLPYIEDLTRQYFAGATPSPAPQKAPDDLLVSYPAAEAVGDSYKFYRLSPVKSSLPRSFTAETAMAPLIDRSDSSFGTFPAFLLPFTLDISVAGGALAPIGAVMIKMPAGVDTRNYVKTLTVSAQEANGNFRMITQASVHRSTEFQFITFEPVTTSLVRLSITQNWGGSEIGIAEVGLAGK